MKVKVLTPLSHNNEYLEPGTLVELSDDVANKLLEDNKKHPVIVPTDENGEVLPEPQPDGQPLMKDGSVNPDKKAGAFNKGDKKVDPKTEVQQANEEASASTEEEQTSGKFA